VGGWAGCMGCVGRGQDAWGYRNGKWAGHIGGWAGGRVSGWTVSQWGASMWQGEG